MPVDLESGRENGGLRWECEGLLWGRGWIRDPVKGMHTITSGQTQPTNLCAFSQGP